MRKIWEIIRAARKALKYNGNIVRKYKYFYFSLLAIKNNVINFRVDRIASQYTADWFDLKEIPQKKRNGHTKEAMRAINFGGMV